MDGEKFDDLIRRFCTTRLTRISALRGLAAGAAAVLTGATLASDETDAKSKKKKKGGAKKGGAKKGGAGGQNSNLRIASEAVACACPDRFSPKGCPNPGDNPQYTCKAAESGAGCGVDTNNAPRGSVQVGCDGGTPFCYCNSTTCVVNGVKYSKDQRVDKAGATCTPFTCPSNSCDDNDLCTKDTCNQSTGLCEHVEKDCSALDDQCNTGVCDESTGECVKRFKAGDCDDGLFCNVGEACTENADGSGSCTGGTARDCTELDDQCNVGVCNEETNACEAQFVAGDCNDGLFCNVGEACTENADGSGSCTGGTARDCTELDDQCNVGVCNEETNACEAQFVAGDCNDGLFCNVGEACTENADGSGSCTGGTARDCTELDDQCNVGVCNEETNACEAQFVAGDCNDGLFCNVGEACTENADGSGSCTGGTARDCTELDDQCNVGVCNEETNACEAQFVAGDCNDGLFCNVGEACTENADGSGSCTGGTARDCGDAISCTVDTCNETAGICEHTPNDGLCEVRTGCTATCDPSNEDAEPDGCVYVCDECQVSLDCQQNQCCCKEQGHGRGNRCVGVNGCTGSNDAGEADCCAGQNQGGTIPTNLICPA